MSRPQALDELEAPGDRGLGRLVEANDDLAAHLADRIAAADDLEAIPAGRPELSVVCFRHLPGGRARAAAVEAVDPAAIDRYTDRLATLLQHSGEGWLSTTVLRGRTFLRAGIVNFLSSPARSTRSSSRSGASRPRPPGRRACRPTSSAPARPAGRHAMRRGAVVHAPCTGACTLVIVASAAPDSRLRARRGRLAERGRPNSVLHPWPDTGLRRPPRAARPRSRPPSRIATPKLIVIDASPALVRDRRSATAARARSYGMAASSSPGVIGEHHELVPAERPRTSCPRKVRLDETDDAARSPRPRPGVRACR